MVVFVLGWGITTARVPGANTVDVNPGTLDIGSKRNRKRLSWNVSAPLPPHER
jgi:hypothetical protein